MKKIGLVASLLFVLVSNLSAQNTDTLTYPEHEARKNFAVYQLAKEFNDPAVARMALYQLMVYSPNQVAVLDSLALEYYGSQNFLSAALVSNEVLKINPSDELALEVAAISLNNLGAKDQALEKYEKLYLKNDDTNTLYKMAFLQYELKKFKESAASVEILMKRSDVDAQNVVFTKADQTNQEVSMRAALTNLEGLIALDEENLELAQNKFLEALKLAPGFERAQANLKVIMDKEK